MNNVDILGWVAAALVLTTFCLKTMVALRTVAIASNLLFIFYGVFSHAVPILALHCLLLPLNTWRVLEIFLLKQKVLRSSGSEIFPSMLLPFMKRGSAASGTHLFLQGDIADQVYVLLSGEVQLQGVRRIIAPGQLLGVVGVFSPSKRRTDTAQCVTDVEYATITVSKFWELVYQDPMFGNYLIRTIVGRQIALKRQ